MDCLNNVISDLFIVIICLKQLIVNQMFLNLSVTRIHAWNIVFCVMEYWTAAMQPMRETAVIILNTKE